MIAATASFTEDDLANISDQMAQIDPDLARIIDTYGYPPFWSRPNTYESLVWIIIEQQVSLASAKATLEKLRAYIGEITPENVLRLSDEELRAVYFSRQKTIYVRQLSQEIIDGKLDLDQLAALSNDAIRSRLIKLKGIGTWTIDIYLIMVLHRSDVFPLGDLAVISALKELKDLPKSTPKEKLEPITATWAPYRTIGAMLLWHYYLSRRIKT